ncbi:MAG: UTRA domain-containing protein [Alcaligenaceae bacterium]|nr:UTRA domain-containing protein [Alcaligenaceae bacterium SAGV5]MPS50551.1 UTRA domain-containing protein [Alcaligenaceae bacterium SAGV3]MPT59664.1 UTRA domain-containing protein [Alcaligenaceae bacterium]
MCFARQFPGVNPGAGQGPVPCAGCWRRFRARVSLGMGPGMAGCAVVATWLSLECGMRALWERLMSLNASGQKTGYSEVKAEIRAMIERGGWKPGVRLPSERALESQFGCARLTVRRALQELQAEGLIERRHGSGSYVADLNSISNVLMVKDVHQEIVERGHRHSSKVLSRQKLRASAAIADAMGLGRQSDVFYCEVLHFENGVPIQFEERFINPEVIPDFLGLDLDSHTASSYLFARAPLTAAEQVIEAVNAEPAVARLLGVADGAALLRVSRRTESQGRVASVARLYHPGHSYRLIGAFSSAA